MNQNFLASLTDGYLAGQKAQRNVFDIRQEQQDQRDQSVMRLAQGLMDSQNPEMEYPRAKQALAQMGRDVTMLPDTWQEAQPYVRMYLNQGTEADFRFFNTPQGVVRADRRTGGAEIALPMEQPDPIAKMRAQAVAAGLQPGTPEYEKFMRDGGRGPSVNVNVEGDRSQNAFETAMGKNMATLFQGYVDGAGAANEQLNNFAELERLISDPNVTMGFGSEALLGVKRIFAQAGMDVAGLDSAEAAQAMSANMALDALGNLKGVASDTDMRVVMDTTARLSDTREGALAKVQIARRAAQYRVAVAQAAEEYVAQFGQLDQGWIRRRNEMSARFRQEVLQEVQSSQAFSGYTRQDAESRAQQLQSEGMSEQQIIETLRAEGFL